MTSARFRYSGINPSDDPLHYTFDRGSGDKATGSDSGTKRIKAPLSVELANGQRVAQWAPTVRSNVQGFRPDRDCEGNFTSAKFQVNNNCYNYACNIATNTFALPGRKHGLSYTDKKGRLTQKSVLAAVDADGLRLVGGPDMSLATALKKVPEMRLGPGHLIALVISKPKAKIGWNGDFHFVRCDQRNGGKWSQKNGPDQITNFDYAGLPIRDPSSACWIVNQGPADPSRSTAVRSEYQFAAWLFVPYETVDII
jgi:hypothetical protein